MLIGFSARSRSRIERRAFFAKSSSVRDRPTAGGFEMMLPDQRAGVAIWRIGVTICAETSARWPARCFRSRPGCCERPRGSRDQCGLPGLFLPIASIFANAARRCSSRNLPMPSSAAVGLSWFVCRRMVCSIVELAAARINDLLNPRKLAVIFTCGKTIFCISLMRGVEEAEMNMLALDADCRPPLASKAMPVNTLEA